MEFLEWHGISLLKNQGIPDHFLLHLEMVQQLVARIVLQIRQSDQQSMSEVLRELHWLPVKSA